MTNLEKIRESAEAAKVYYVAHGFQARVGYGTRPALVNVDLAKAWTRPGNPFHCPGADDIIAHVQRLLAVARRKGIPVVFTTTAYEPGEWDAGLWALKIPSLRILRRGSPLTAIDERLDPQPGEHVIVKTRASAFFGTKLAPMLTALGVDTVLVTGTTACGCIRHTVEDAIAHGFRPIVVRETIGDRVPGVLEWNLFDIDAKFGDVESVEDALKYLEGIEPFKAPV
jgi:N-carbamoylsarcosine amidase